MASYLPKTVTVCAENPGSDLVQLEEHGSNTGLIELSTPGVTLNEPGPTGIADGDSFVTASEHRPESSKANNATSSNRGNLVQDVGPEDDKSQAECLAAFEDIQDALCKQLYQLQLTQSKAVSFLYATIPHYTCLPLYLPGTNFALPCRRTSNPDSKKERQKPICCFPPLPSSTLSPASAIFSR